MGDPERHVLVIDDDERILRVWQRFARRSGVRLSAAVNLAEAKALLARHTFTKVVADYRLRDGSPVGLLAQVGRDQPCVELLVVTGDDTGVRAELTSSGVDAAVVLKPPPLAEILVS